MNFFIQEDKNIVEIRNKLNHLAEALNEVIKQKEEQDKNARYLVQPLARINFLLGRKKLLKSFLALKTPVESNGVQEDGDKIKDLIKKLILMMFIFK